MNRKINKFCFLALGVVLVSFWWKIYHVDASPEKNNFIDHFRSEGFIHVSEQNICNLFGKHAKNISEGYAFNNLLTEEEIYFIQTKNSDAQKAIIDYFTKMIMTKEMLGQFMKNRAIIKLDDMIVYYSLADERIIDDLLKPYLGISALNEVLVFDTLTDQSDIKKAIAKSEMLLPALKDKAPIYYGRLVTQTGQFADLTKRFTFLWIKSQNPLQLVTNLDIMNYDGIEPLQSYKELDLDTNNTFKNAQLYMSVGLALAKKQGDIFIMQSPKKSEQGQNFLQFKTEKALKYLFASKALIFEEVRQKDNDYNLVFYDNNDKALNLEAEIAEIKELSQEIIKSVQSEKITGELKAKNSFVFENDLIAADEIICLSKSDDFFVEIKNKKITITLNKNLDKEKKLTIKFKKTSKLLQETEQIANSQTGFFASENEQVRLLMAMPDKNLPQFSFTINNVTKSVKKVKEKPKEDVTFEKETFGTIHERKVLAIHNEVSLTKEGLNDWGNHLELFDTSQKQFWRIRVDFGMETTDWTTVAITDVIPEVLEIDTAEITVEDVFGTPLKNLTINTLGQEVFITPDKLDDNFSYLLGKSYIITIPTVQKEGITTEQLQNIYKQNAIYKEKKGIANSAKLVINAGEKTYDSVISTIGFPLNYDVPEFSPPNIPKTGTNKLTYWLFFTAIAVSSVICKKIYRQF